MPVAAKRPTTRPSGIQAALFENEDVLQRDHFAFHAGDFGEIDHPARTVAQAGGLHQQVHGAGDLLPDRDQLHVGAGQRHHHLQARNRVARAVGVDRGERSVVAGVHGLQHVERFLAADFAHHDAVRAHTQAVDQQLALPDRAMAFQVGRPGLQARHVRLLQLQFGRVFNGDDALFGRDEGRQSVQQRGLSGAGSARDDDVHAGP